eukprot:Clim_evm17s146 gene=Clim_evmTU17s146
MFRNLVLSLALAVATQTKADNDLNKAIYTSFSYNAPCVLLLNAGGEAGCATGMDGNIGTIFQVANADDLNELIENGPRTPYVPLVADNMWNRDTYNQLVSSGKVNGALVYKSDIRPADNSPADKCPSCEFGPSGIDTTYEWNPDGGDLLDVPIAFPVTFLTNDTDQSTAQDCASQNFFTNAQGQQVHADWPVCSGQLETFMHAAEDAETCLRLQRCDPLGAESIVGFLHQPASGDQITVMTAKLDSRAFFHDITNGADDAATGIAALLGIVDALEQEYARNTTKFSDKNIMFAFLHGESWDYIGSSRMVTALINDGDFPEGQVNGQDVDAITINDIERVVELRQMHDRGTYYVHSLNETSRTAFSTTPPGASTDITVDAASATPNQLPPSSSQMFRRLAPTTDTIVFANHDQVFTNPFFWSQFDDDVNIGTSNQTTTGTLCSIADYIARVTFSEITGTNVSTDFAIDCTLVYNILNSFTVDMNSDYIRTLFDGIAAAPEGPANFYVGVYGNSFLTQSLVSARNETYEAGSPFDAMNVVYRQMAISLASGTPVATDDEGLCDSPSIAAASMCYTAPVIPYAALSQGLTASGSKYVITDDTFSTWTESRWDNGTPSIRSFNRNDALAGGLVLLGGFITLGVSAAVTYGVHLHIKNILTPK